MPTYNFTVRATDDLGAYADRDFSINVRNTIVDRYLLLSGTSVYGSSNLSEWTERPNASASTALQFTNTSIGLNFNSKVFFLNGRWITYKFAPNSTIPYSLLSYSDDGINWILIDEINIDDVAYNMNTNNQNHIGSLCVESGKLYAYFSQTYTTGLSNNSVMISSEDGINWTTVSSSTFVNANHHFRFTKCNGSWFYTGFPGSSVTNSTRMIYKSTNAEGTEWTTITLPGVIIDNYRLVGVKYFNGMYIVMGNRTTYYTSVDGVNWVSRTMPSLGNWEIPTDIVYGNGRLVMTTMHFKTAAQSYAMSASKVYTSVDGINWRTSSFDSYAEGSGSVGINGAINCVFSNGRFIISAWPTNNGTGGLRVSYDGLTWTTITDGVPSVNYAIGVMNI